MIRKQSLKIQLESVLSPAMVIDEEGGIVESNAALMETAGIKPGTPFALADLFDEENLEEFGTVIRQMVTQKDKVMSGVSFKDADAGGRRLMTAAPVQNKKGQVQALVVIGKSSGESSIYTDFLTKLPNRQEAAIRLRYEWNRSSRAGTLFSLCLADIDHFKRVNDTLGHEAGDEVLVHVAGVLDQQVRGSDWCARWGGEEFMLLLNDITAKEAEFVLNRVRQNLVQNPPVYNGNSIPVTLSFGMVSKGAAYKTFKDMVNDADVLLYESKASGRNRVTLFDTKTTAVAWNRNEIQNMIKGKTLRPLYRRIMRQGGEGGIAGFEVVPHFENMDEAQTRRLWQSAHSLNMLLDLELQLVSWTLKNRSEAASADSQEFIIPLSSKLASDPNLLIALDRENLDSLKQCVFMLEGDLELSREDLVRIKGLTERGCRIGIRDIELNKIPLKFLSEQKVAYLFITLDAGLRSESREVAQTDKPPILRNLLESIRGAGTEIVVVKSDKTHEVDERYAGLVYGSLFRGVKAVPLSKAIKKD